MLGRLVDGLRTDNYHASLWSTTIDNSMQTGSIGVIRVGLSLTGRRFSRRSQTELSTQSSTGRARVGLT
jgi:hypothetical protein